MATNIIFITQVLYVLLIMGKFGLNHDLNGQKYSKLNWQNQIKNI